MCGWRSICWACPTREAHAEVAGTACRWWGWREKAASRVTQLSMGQRQRVALARALAGDPELILADEPTASLDADSGFNAMRVLKELCQSLNKTVIVVTHDSRIFPMADRILTLADGKIVADEPPGQPPATTQEVFRKPLSAVPPETPARSHEHALDHDRHRRGTDYCCRFLVPAGPHRSGS